MFPNPCRVAAVLVALGAAGWLATAPTDDPEQSVRLAVAQLRDDGSAVDALAADRDARHHRLSLTPTITLYLAAVVVATAAAGGRTARRLLTPHTRSES